MAKQVILGFMGNRGFFPSEFTVDGAEATKVVVEAILGDAAEYIDLGSIETYAEAKRAASIAQRYKLDPNGAGCIGIVLSMYNFSDENGVRDFLRLADLNVPVLVHTEPDSRGKGCMGETGRRDGACGRFSVANALRHIGHPYTLTRKHVVPVASDEFADDLRAFVATCKIAAKFRRRGRGLRLGLVGSGPDAFQTVTTVSTELFGHMGLVPIGMTLLELDRRMQACTDTDVATKIKAFDTYLGCSGVPDASVEAIARMGLVYDRFVEENDLDGLAIRCWTEMQKFRIGGVTGIVPCACMSMLSERGIPAACEVDISGWMGMYMLQTASDLIPALADWNNMYADAEDEIDLFHCGPWAKSLLKSSRMASQQIIATDPDVRTENTWGTVDGNLKPGASAFLRPCTNAREGNIFMFGGVGEILDTDIDTFGCRGRLRIPRLQEFARHVLAPERAVEHHTPIVVADAARIGLAMQAVRNAVPYINAQAGTNAAGTPLIDYYEHSTVAEL